MSDGALIRSVKQSDYAAVVSLLDQGHDVHERGEQEWPALNFAAGQGDRDMVRLLIERGADVFLTGADGRTPYKIALAASHLDVARDLRRREEEVGGDRERISSREWETRLFCKAYRVADLRGRGWNVGDTPLPRREHDDNAAPEDGAPLQDDDVVFIHGDYSVTRSFWAGERVLITGESAEWRAFCDSVLSFQVPRDLE